jgi:hypothetical protein
MEMSMFCAASPVRTLVFSAAAAAAILCSPAAAQPGERATVTREAPPAAGRSPFLGEWELDLTRMPDNYGPPPKRVTFAFRDLGSGEWQTIVEITAPDDSVRHIEARYRRDGRAVQAAGDTADGDSAAFSAPAPNVLMMSQGKDGGLAGARVYVVSADGREMTEAAAGVDGSGAPFVRNFHFRRIR